MKLGGWELDNAEVRAVLLPQKVASAFYDVTSDMVGADYTPVAYIGEQIVNGVNYCVIALQSIVAPQSVDRLVKMILHVNTEGRASLKSISKIEL